MLTTPPASVDLRRWAVTPGDQGALGSCVTWAIDYAMLGWYANFSGRPGAPFAPMYTYSQIDGGVDRGSYPGDALRIAKTQGNDTRADYTQGDYDFRTQPTAAEHTNAAKFKIKGYETLFAGSQQAGTVTLIKQALAANQPVAIEMPVRHGFDTLGSNPAAVDDDITSAVRGYHEVLAVGYDAAGLIIQNSWSTGWANGGFGRLSWRVVQNDVVEGDTIDGFVTPPPPTPPVVAKPTIAVVKTTGVGAAAKISYKVSWKGTAGTSGKISNFFAWVQVDGHAFGLMKLTAASATSASFTMNAHLGHPYRIAIRAAAGKTLGAIRYTNPFVPKPAKPGATVPA